MPIDEVRLRLLIRHRNSQEFVTKPWSVTIEGEVESPVTISAEEIISLFPSEERIYKLRCVEGWSMVIPWMGFSLSKLLNKVSIKNTAKFVEFESVYDESQDRQCFQHLV